jgi:hypothetical protein
LVDVKGPMKIGYADEGRYTRDKRMNKEVTMTPQKKVKTYLPSRTQ